MRVYYAHCINIYSTPQEDRDVSTLEKLGFEVSNPNSQDADNKCEEIRRRWNAGDMGGSYPDKPRLTGFREVGEAVMGLVFGPMVSASDAVAFRALPDGRIPAGVAKEIAWALEKGVPVFELPSNVLGRVMNVDQTDAAIPVRDRCAMSEAEAVVLGLGGFVEGDHVKVVSGLLNGEVGRVEGHGEAFFGVQGASRRPHGKAIRVYLPAYSQTAWFTEDELERSL